MCRSFLKTACRYAHSVDNQQTALPHVSIVTILTSEMNAFFNSIINDNLSYAELRSHR